jgi:predicted metal-binding protein
MARYRRGILLQTVGKLEKTIDTRGYRRTEQKHLADFHRFVQQVKQVYPDALCLGTGGCRICEKCAWPEPCRFPEKACASMEGYGLFVTQVCRDSGLKYHHGEKTITYTACVLFPEKTGEKPGKTDANS